MTLWFVLAAARCLLVSAATQTPREQIAVGLMQGFVSDRSDLNDCVGGTDGILTGADAALKQILKGDLRQKAEGLRKLADALDSIPAVMAVCRASRADVAAMLDALKLIKGMKGLLARIASDIRSDGARIRSDIVGSVAAFEALDYKECGRRLGAALRRLVVAERPMPPPPRPQPPYNRLMHERSPVQMKRAESTDRLEVYWNLTPMCEEQLNSWAGAIGLFHVSVGFVNLRTGLNSTFEFTADNFNGMLLFPLLNFTDRSMVWNNTARLHAKEGELDLEYWQFRTRIAIIDGTAYNAFLSWSQVAVDQFTRYHLFNFAVAGSDRPQFDAFTCFDAVAMMLQSISNISGPCVFDRSLPGVVRSDIYVWGSTEAVPIDKTSSQMAFNYYAAITKIPDLRNQDFEVKMAEIVRLMGELKSGQAVFHDPWANVKNDRYWSFKPAKPIISYKTVVAPLPGGCQDQAVLI